MTSLLAEPHRFPAAPPPPPPPAPLAAGGRTSVSTWRPSRSTDRTIISIGLVECSFDVTTIFGSLMNFLFVLKLVSSDDGGDLDPAWHSRANLGPAAAAAADAPALNSSVLLLLVFFVVQATALDSESDPSDRRVGDIPPPRWTLKVMELSELLVETPAAVAP